MPLIDFTDNGLYCARGDFYIDPQKPVAKALITHAHSDHARAGHQYYLAQRQSIPILQLRLGRHHYQAIDWGESVFINGIKISYHPAGHIIGSAQIRLEYQGEVWVVSGDYKLEDDGLSGAFEPVVCHTFITESTFGLPLYQWKPQATIFTAIKNWIRKNQENGITSVLFAYSLGKAQRLVHNLAADTGKIYVHGAIESTHTALEKAGCQLPPVSYIRPGMDLAEIRGGLVIAPPGADDSPWLKKLGNTSVGVCSGWMQVRGHFRRRNADAGFALSDHADWDGLLKAVKATRAEKVYVTHGFSAAFSRYLNENGIAAAEVKTGFSEERVE